MAHDDTVVLFSFERDLRDERSILIANLKGTVLDTFPCFEIVGNDILCGLYCVCPRDSEVWKLNAFIIAFHSAVCMPYVKIVSLHRITMVLACFNGGRSPLFRPVP